MAGKFNIYLELKNEEIREDILRKISDDWTINWGIVSKEQNNSEPEMTDLAVIDNINSLENISRKTTLVFIGHPPEKNNFFAVLEKPESNAIFKSIKRANSYREISRQNEVSLFTEKNNKGALEEIAESLSIHLHQLQRQSEMRIALVEQLPVGVMGIDDENTVVLVNPKAVEILGVEDIPVWGLGVDVLLSESVGGFVRNENLFEMTLNRNGQNIIIRKSKFILDDSFAGTILVLWKISEHK